MTIREPSHDEKEAAEAWLGERMVFTRAGVVAALAAYANHVGAEIYEHAATMLPDAVHGVRGSNVVELRYLQGHLRNRAKRLRS